MIGTILDGRYRILRQLGTGAVGEVFLVEHVRLERREALKVLGPGFANDPSHVARFRREARATNRVQHPNIVGLHDFGQLPDGRLFLAMEYAEGEALDRVLAREGRLALPRVLGLVAQLADAVDYAHACGVVHRDLKPANLVLVKDRPGRETVKVLDFGMAKIVSPEHAESVGISARGEARGTPAYMAPELFVGEKDVDPRCDLYAIGCIAFELAAGTPPFCGRLMEIASGHLYQAPEPPSRRCPEARLPAAFDAIVLRCLEKQPAKRFSAGRELRAALEHVAGWVVPRNRRVGATTIAPSALTASRPPAGAPFEDEPTATDGAAGALAGTTTAPMALEAARAVVRATVRALAEALIDQGCREVRLIIGASHLKDVEDEHAQEESERASLEEHVEAIDQAARERVASLRFALGELTFEHTRAARDPAVRQELGEQIAELERRVGEVTAEADSRGAGPRARAIELVARAALREEALDAACAELAAVLLALVPRFRHQASLGALEDRLRTGLALLAAARAPEAGR